MTKIKLFTKVGCPYCAEMRESLKAQGLEYDEVDVFSSPQAMQEALRYSGGHKKVPILIQDGKVTVAPNGG